MVRAGQSSEKAALIYQHSDGERQQEVAEGIAARVRAARNKTAQMQTGRAGSMTAEGGTTGAAKTLRE